MSYMILRRCGANTVTRGGSVIPALMHPPSTSKSCLTSRPTPCLFPGRHIGAIVAQSRFFHQTQARRNPLWPLGTVNVVAYTFVIFIGVRLIQVLTGYSTLPPHTWARTTDQRTRHQVEATLSTAFNIARNAPPRQRHNKLREASFLVPYEVARLNKSAPEFHLQDLGPVYDGRIRWDKKTGGPPLDAKTETRAFLYFPNGSSKAAAIFLSVNSELSSLKKVMKQSPAAADSHIINAANSVSLIAAFSFTHTNWKRSRHRLADPMRGSVQLPVICNFQESVFGCAYYPGVELLGVPAMALAPLDLTDLGSKFERRLK